MRGIVTACAVVAVAVSACTAERDEGGRPSIVVTSNILGDIVTEIAGDSADIEVLLPRGADPHEFAASARQADAMSRADLLVVNGGGFEAGLDRVIEAAEADGAPVFAFTDEAELVDGDPHVFTDPVRMADAVVALGEELGELDAGAPARAEAYAQDLLSLDEEIRTIVDTIQPERRVLVTNHDVFGYFAGRYGFEIVGVVIPGGTTLAEPSASDLDELAGVIRRKGVPAIFAETSSSTSLSEALADLVGDVEVVSLFTESLGEPGSGADTYLGLLRTDAELIAAALS